MAETSHIALEEALLLLIDQWTRTSAEYKEIHTMAPASNENATFRAMVYQRHADYGRRASELRAVLQARESLADESIITLATRPPPADGCH